MGESKASFSWKVDDVSMKSTILDVKTGATCKYTGAVVQPAGGSITEEEWQLVLHAKARREDDSDVMFMRLWQGSFNLFHDHAVFRDAAEEVERISEVPKWNAKYGETGGVWVGLASNESGWCAHGEGTISDTLSAAHLYQGSFVYGYRDGTGAGIITVGGTVVGTYSGEWRLNMRHGVGIMKSSEGRIKFRGGYRFDRKHGRGVEYGVDGSIYEGWWRNGKRDGAGLFVWPDGMREYREYSDGKTVQIRNVRVPGELPEPSHVRDDADECEEADDTATGGGGAGGGGGGEGGLSVVPSSPGLSLSSVASPRHGSSAVNAEAKRLLATTLVDELSGGLTAGIVATVKLSDNVETVLNTLTKHKILSVPVFNEETGTYVAFVHLMDIAHLVVKMFGKKKPSLDGEGSMREKLTHQRMFAMRPISDVVDPKSPHMKFHALPRGSPLSYVVQALCSGAHAAAITDATGSITRIVTQSDLIRFLAAKLDRLGRIRTRTASQLGIKLTLPVVAKFDDTTIDILKKMKETGSPAAPVVDQYGSLSANLSMSDLKNIAHHGNFAALTLPVRRFFQALQGASESSRMMNPSIFVRPSAPMDKLIMTLAATRVHQLYFVGDGVKPKGAISTNDVLMELIRE